MGLKEFLFVDVQDVMKKFPETSDTIIMDCYLTDEPECSSRVFRLYDRIPKHYHEQCNEILYLLEGKAKFYINDEEPRILEKGMMVTFYKRVVHLVESIGEKPATFLSCDTPRRDPDDAHFLDPKELSGRKFVSHISL